MSPARFVPATVACAAVLAFAWWVGTRPHFGLAARLPGADGRGAAGAGAETSAPTSAAKLLRFDGAPADLPGEWPGFRGKARDGIAAEAKGLRRQWPPAGPPVLWSVDVGEGYAGAAVLGGRVFLHDYDREGQADAVRCFSLGDGKEIWRYSYPVPVKRNHGMSRTVPAVTPTHVVALGPKCHVTCLDAATGELRWQVDLVKDFGAKVPPWYAGQCPLVEDGRVILATGGDDLMVAMDIASGAVVWRSPNPRGWQMTHSSILPLVIEGTRMFVYCASGGVAGVSAADGSPLWDTDAWKINIATVPSPVDLGGGRLFLSGGYNAGALFIRIRKEGGAFAVEPGKRLDPETFGSTQQTPIFFGGHVFGVRPDGQLACLDLEGNVVWTSGGGARFGLGPYLIADGLLYVLDDSGLLTVAEATAETYKPLAQAQVLNGHESWGPLALAGVHLIARDFTRMVCLDIGGSS